MSRSRITPFDSIESSHEYVSLLAEAVEVALAEVKEDMADGSGIDDRRREALLLVCFKLEKLRAQMNSSRRILNDLRSLRRMFERASAPDAAVAPPQPERNAARAAV